MDKTVQVRELRKKGHSMTTIAEATGLTQGYVQRILSAGSSHISESARATEGLGHYAGFEMVKSVKPLRKDMPGGAPLFALKARALLMKEHKLAQVLSEVGCTVEDLRPWIQPDFDFAVLQHSYPGLI